MDAQTPDTAAQEVLALLLAAALLAGQREAVAAHAGVPLLRISFAKVLHKTAALCELLAIGGDLIPPDALAQWLQRILDDLQTAALIQARPPRSCPPHPASTRQRLAQNPNPRLQTPRQNHLHQQSLQALSHRPSSMDRSADQDPAMAPRI